MFKNVGMLGYFFFFLTAPVYANYAQLFDLEVAPGLPIDHILRVKVYADPVGWAQIPDTSEIGFVRVDFTIFDNGGDPPISEHTKNNIPVFFSDIPGHTDRFNLEFKITTPFEQVQIPLSVLGARFSIPSRPSVVVTIQHDPQNNVWDVAQAEVRPGISLETLAFYFPKLSGEQKVKLIMTSLPIVTSRVVSPGSLDHLAAKIQGWIIDKRVADAKNSLPKKNALSKVRSFYLGNSRKNFLIYLGSVKNRQNNDTLVI